MGKRERWKWAEQNHRGHQGAGWWPRAGGSGPDSAALCAPPPGPGGDRLSLRLPRRLRARGCGRPGGGGGPGEGVSLTSGWSRRMEPLPAASRERDKGTKGEARAPGVPAPCSPGRPGPGRTSQDRAGQGRAGPGRAGRASSPPALLLPLQSGREARPLACSIAVAAPKSLCLALSRQGEEALGAWQFRCYSFPLDSLSRLQGEGTSENSYTVPKRERCTNHVLLYSQLLDFPLNGNDWKDTF